MFGQFGQLAELMKNAGKLRESMAESMEKIDVEGIAGGGGVRVRVNGRMEITQVTIAPHLLATGDQELLEDLVAAAVNQGLQRAKEEAAQSMSDLAGGLPIPGLSGFLGPMGPGGGGPESPSGPAATDSETGKGPGTDRTS